MIKFSGNHFVDYYEEWGFRSPQELAESLASFLHMKSGSLAWNSGTFEAEGVLTNGNKLYIYQEGEFDMYEGFYDPKMKKPLVKVDDHVIPVEMIVEICKENDIDIDPHNFPDVVAFSREWGNLLLLKKTTIKAKSLGLI